MTHLGLFEGIGGFSLAARWAGWTTPVMVEWNPYCQAVLKKNFPDATIFSDIRNFGGTAYAGQIDIITGGFPCQPFSHAGKRNGTDDDRYLWPEMLRVIREVAPSWVVGENVAGLLSMDGGLVFAGILADMENAGYSTETYLIPAISVGAPHRRDRLWIVAHAARIGKRKQDNQAHPIGAGRQTWEDFGGGNWGVHWYEVATRICGMDDGIPAGVDGVREIPAKKNTGKRHRLEALGNAIVPQVAYEIFNAINKFGKGKKNAPANTDTNQIELFPL